MPTFLSVIIWILAGLTALALLLLIAIAFLLYFVVYARNIPKYATPLLGGHMDSDLSDPAEVKRIELAKETEEYVETREYDEMHTQSFDGLRLYARLLKGDPASKRVAILIHGYHSSATLDFGGMVQFYHKKGYHVLLPDGRAHGKSEGKLLGFGWLDRRDAISWCKKVIRMFGPEAEIILAGVSMGAAAVMMASGEEDLPRQVKVLIEDCGFSSTIAQFEYMFPKEAAFLRKPVLFFDNLISLIFNHYSLYKASSVKQLEKNTRPIMLIHGAEDTFVPASMLDENADAAQTFKRILVVPGAEHAKAYDQNTEKYEAAVSQFLADTIGL